MLATVIISGAEIKPLSRWKNLPASSGTELGSAITCHSTIRVLSSRLRKKMKARELIRLVAVSASAALKQFIIQRINLGAARLSYAIRS